MKTKWSTWLANMERVARVIRSLGGTVYGPKVQSPATEAEIENVERALGRALPMEFRRCLLECSRGLEFYWDVWTLDGQPLGDFVDEGGIGWGLDLLLEFESFRKEEIEAWSRYHEVQRLEHALVLTIGPDRDALGFDLRAEGEPPVVLLDHGSMLTDERAWLARGFEDFIDRWSVVGFAGQVRPVLGTFAPVRGAGLDVNAEELQPMREALGL